MKVRSRLLIACSCALVLIGAVDGYELGPDSKPQQGVPEGKVEGPIVFKSKIFEGTTREYFIYVPAQYDKDKPAAVMVFQDGSSYVNKNGSYRVPVVFDNLIAKKEMPVTIGIFVNPGQKGEASPKGRGAPTTARSSTIHSAIPTQSS